MPQDDTRACHKKEWMLGMTRDMVRAGGQIVVEDAWAKSLSKVYDAIEAQVYGDMN